MLRDPVVAAADLIGESVMSNGAYDAMSAVEFQEELRRAGRHDIRVLLEHPLDRAVQKVRENPAFTQSRLVSRMLIALTYQRGEFRRAEASALDTATLGLVIALMDAAEAGTTPRHEWIEAVAACEAAALA